MIPPAFYIPIACIIYLIGLLIKSWKRMTRHEDLTAATELFACWGIVFFGLLATPENIISVFLKSVFSLVDTVIVVTIGLMYFRWERFKELWKRIVLATPVLSFWFWSAAELFIVVSYAFLATAILRIHVIDGIFVVTYDNVFCGLLYLIAIYFAYNIVRRMASRQKERENQQLLQETLYT